MHGLNKATRNTGKSIAGRNIANPTAMLLASCLMLDHLKLHEYASMIRKAIFTTMNETQFGFISLGDCKVGNWGLEKAVLERPADFYHISKSEYTLAITER
ncbi:hypothetical protein QTP86_003772 [Hemibagrus guttatus]|nr:hypothetical protein QTP86_003772 [Hemibagrus guttatus]